MTQATFLTVLPDIIQEHSYKQLPQCICCQRRYTEKEFVDLRRTGHNIVWDIDYAECPECGGEVQGWEAGKLTFYVGFFYVARIRVFTSDTQQFHSASPNQGCIYDFILPHAPPNLNHGGGLSKTVKNHPENAFGFTFRVLKRADFSIEVSLWFSKSLIYPVKFLNYQKRSFRQNFNRGRKQQAVHSLKFI